jgi:hypothetical protein
MANKKVNYNVNSLEMLIYWESGMGRRVQAKKVAYAPDGFQKFWILGVIPQKTTEAGNIDINHAVEPVVLPGVQSLQNVVPADYLAGMSDKERQKIILHGG